MARTSESLIVRAACRPDPLLSTILSQSLAKITPLALLFAILYCVIIDVLMIRRMSCGGEVLAIHIQKENINDFAITFIQGVNSNYIVIRSLGFMWWVSFICFSFRTDNGIFAATPVSRIRPLTTLTLLYP